MWLGKGVEPYLTMIYAYTCLCALGSLLEKLWEPYRVSGIKLLEYLGVWTTLKLSTSVFSSSPCSSLNMSFLMFVSFFACLHFSLRGSLCSLLNKHFLSARIFLNFNKSYLLQTQYKYYCRNFYLVIYSFIHWALVYFISLLVFSL